MEDSTMESLCLPIGNRKVGRVWTFSLPSYVTCPGASPWCLELCYAWRIERLRPNCRLAYMKNLILAFDREAFVRHVLRALPSSAEVVRVHVGGDFFSQQYVEAWTEICSARPDTTFWSYTRSWVVPSLLPSLEQLRDLSNVHLFASTDPTMPMPPHGWRKAFLDIDLRATGLRCRHQQGQVPSCQECGHCFSSHSGSVVFVVH